MSHRHLLLALLLCLPAHCAFAGNTVIGTCDLKNVFQVTDSEDFLKFDAALRAAVKANDPVALSLLVNFPLTLLGTRSGSISINNASTLQTRSDLAFPEPVRQAILNQDPLNFWCKEDWVHYQDSNAEVVVKQFDVGSAKEFRIDYIARIDSETPPQSKTMRPIKFICHTPKYRIIVDSDVNDNEKDTRYRAWIKPHAATDKPDMEIIGATYDGGGNGECAESAWIFKNGNTQYEASELGCTDGSEPKGTTGYVDITIADKPAERLWCYK